MNSQKCLYSVIVTLDEEHEDFISYIRRLNALFADRNEPYEILIIANGTGGFLRIKNNDLYGINNRIKAFEFSRKTSAAVCMKAAMAESAGEIIVATGPYQQITEESFHQLLDEMTEDIDILSPWRQNRVDPSFNRFQSKVFNDLARLFLNSNLHDLSCTIKIFRRKVFDETEIYGNMYRFLPVVASPKGFKTREIRCEHFEERGKTGFYSISEYITRLIDILTLYFNVRFSKKPLRFFSSVGLAFLSAGLLIMAVLFILRFIIGSPIGNSPLLLISILLMVLGVQAASVGLLGEIVAFVHGRKKKEYTIEKII